MHPAPRRAALVLCALSLLPWLLQGLEPARASTRFAAEVERLSEAEGAFDTDNLISNERSYVDVIPALLSAGAHGGVYIGVGPDQNFSYIARVRPTTAYIIDVRRDNLLLHLLFKALFATSRSRTEYATRLTGRAPPAHGDDWTNASIEQIVAHIDSAPPDAQWARHGRQELERTIESFGVPLSRGDLDTIARFHDEFIEAGLSLRFRSHGRAPRIYYPTLRELLLATDASGRPWNYLASEDDFQFVRSLQARDALIPVVGNVSGLHAMRAIGTTIAARGERVSAFYISNVESYLFRDGQYITFVDNIRRLPRDRRTVMIRSIFGGAASVSEVAPMDEVVAHASRP
jgi:hypothetical protein